MPVVVNNFRTGEISDRVDRLKAADIVANGALKAKNVVVNMQGGLRKRPGLRWIRRLPTGAQWRRIFAWDKSPEERLTLCYAANGEFKVLLADGTLLDVEGRGNEDAGADMQFYNQGNRVIFTDKREPKHILANPRTAGGDVILLDSETTGGNLYENQAVATAETYTPPADQPFSLAAYNAARKTAMISVEELRSVFTGAATQSNRVGVFAASDFTNNPQNYNQSPTQIAVIQFNEISVPTTGNRQMRVRLAATLPNWVEKIRVVWGAYSREFPYANTSTFTDTANLTAAEWEHWGRDSVAKYAQIIRRQSQSEIEDAVFSTSAASSDIWWSQGAATGQANAGRAAWDGNYIYFNRLPAITSGNTTEWIDLLMNYNGKQFQITRSQSGQPYQTLTGNISISRQTNYYRVRVSGYNEMRTAFPAWQGNATHANTYYYLNPRFPCRTTGRANIVSNGVTLGGVMLADDQTVLRVGASGLDNQKRIVIRFGETTKEFSPNSKQVNLTATEAAHFRAARTLYIKVDPVNVGKESRDGEFHALAVERHDGNNYRGIYFKGKEAYRLNNGGDLTRLPLVNTPREVIALMIDDAFKNQPEVILRTFRARVLPLVAPNRNDTLLKGANLKKLLTVSDFLCFRPPVLNPPLQYYDDEDEYNAEVDRIGRRFCAQTSEATGGSLTSGEYEMEWVATAPVDAWDNQLIAVGGDAMTGGNPTPVANRPELTRRGVTRIFQNSDGNIAEVTGWKYNNDSNSGTPSSLRNTIVNIPGRGGAAGDDPGTPNFDEPAGFDGSPIVAKGTLVPRLIETNNGTIGKSPGRWAMIWNEVDGFPATAVQTQSRLAYGGTTTYPARVWMSVIGQPHNFLDFRPVPNEPKSIDARPDFAIDLELDTSAISQMANEAALLIFTQNEAHIANGPFQASNVATKVTRRFGRLGQERNIGVAAIDEHIFVYANGAPYGLLYEAIDVGYKSQNLSAQRNEDIMRNYDDAKRKVGESDVNVGALADLSVSADNDDLRPVRVVATQPKGLNGAYLVLFLLSDGSVRAFHTLHREEFFAWSRWDFFGNGNGLDKDNDPVTPQRIAANKLSDGTDKVGVYDPTVNPNGRRKIIDISAQGSIVHLLDNLGNVYELEGDQPWDDRDEAAREIDKDEVLDNGVNAQRAAKDQIDIVAELPTIAFVDDRFPGQAVINPKRIEYVALHYRRLSGENKMIVAGDAEQPFTIPIEPEYSGSVNEDPTPTGTDKVTVFRGRRIRNVSADCKQDYDTDLDFTVTITHSGVEPWELLRTETEVDIGKHRREKEREIHRAARIKP